LQARQLQIDTANGSPVTSRRSWPQRQVASRYGIRGNVADDGASGVVTREPRPNDHRATLVTFTQRGQKTAKALEHDHIEFACKLFGDLPDTTYRGFARGLDSVLGRLRELLDA
jgi:hypothetical protein